MRNGQYADQDEWQVMSSQRMLVHDELIVLTGVTDRSQMYAYCRNLLDMPAAMRAALDADARIQDALPRLSEGGEEIDTLAEPDGSPGTVPVERSPDERPVDAHRLRELGM
jgi:hypothetical protein